MTSERVEFYRERGYVVVPGLFGDRTVQRWADRLADVVSGRIAPARGMLVMEDVMVAKGVVEASSRENAIAKIQDFENDPVLYSYVEDSRLLDCVACLVGEDVFSIHTMLINKPPDVDGRHPLHQDLLYFPFRPPAKIVATWTALEKVTRENGCLVVLPGSHRGELLRHEKVDWEFVNGGYFGIEGVGADAARIHLEMDAGDTVFFHPLLVHGSGRNRSDGCRRAISAHYGNVGCTWEWTVGNVLARPYKVVRGAHAGQCWDGAYNTGEPVDPLAYIPADQIDPKLVRRVGERGKD